MTAARGQFSRFAIDNVEIFRLAQVEVAALEHLTQLALASAGGGFADQPTDAGVVERAGQMTRMREQVIAEEYAGLHAPDGVDRGHASAHAGAVKNIVMHQGRRMDHLDDSAQDMMRRRDPATGAGRQQQQHRAKSFAAIVMDMRHHLGDASMRILKGTGQNSLDFFQVGRDRPIRIPTRSERGRTGRRDRIHESSTTEPRTTYPRTQRSGVSGSVGRPLTPLRGVRGSEKYVRGSARGFRNFNPR